MTTLIPKYDQGSSNAVNRPINEKLSEWVSIQDFGAAGDGTTDDINAINAAFTAISSTYGTVYFPPGNYAISTGFTVPTRCNVFCSTGVTITLTGTNFYAINIENGVNFVGNGLLIKPTNAAWNGGAIKIDGAYRFADDYPCAIDGINVLGNDVTKGTGLYLTATNATNFISFVRFSNFTFNTLNYGLTLDCGSSGSAGDSTTWHWINGNLFENFNFYGTTNGLNLVGLTGVPAEIAGNIFSNFEFQISPSASHFPIYVYGASRNYFVNYYIWDWNVETSNPIQFANSASNNQCSGNIDPNYVTHNGVNAIQHLGANLFTKIIADGNIHARGDVSLQFGYDGYQASISNGGNGPLLLTPSTGNNTRVASQFAPSVDDSFALGGATLRWSVVYAATGTINTSDANQKQQLASLTTAEQSTAKAIKGLIKTFKYNSAITEKGENARIHIGVSAQEVLEAFTANGLDATKYGLFCSDTWYTLNGKVVPKETAGSTKVTQLGIRYDELLSFVISAL